MRSFPVVTRSEENMPSKADEVGKKEEIFRNTTQGSVARLGAESQTNIDRGIATRAARSLCDERLQTAENRKPWRMSEWPWPPRKRPERISHKRQTTDEKDDRRQTRKWRGVCVYVESGMEMRMMEEWRRGLPVPVASRGRKTWEEWKGMEWEKKRRR